MTAQKRTPPQNPPAEPSPMAVIGAILAQGAIRLLDRQKREAQLAKLHELLSRLHQAKKNTLDFNAS